MAHFIWSLIYIAIGFWILSRVVAFFIQRLLKKYLDVTLRFGKVGLLNFSKVQMTLEQNVTVHVEVEKIWLSSSFFNPEVRKPLVVCMEDMRIQVGISRQSDGDRNQPQPSVPSQKRQLPKILKKVLHLASYGGLRINNITVMLLKAMVPDCLIHFSSPEMSFDVTVAYDRYELCGNITNLGCKALRSSPENELQENREPQNCLAEFSLTLKSEAKVDKENPLKLVVLKTTMTKPQMMITEGFLQSLQNVNMQGAASDYQTEDDLSLNEIANRSLPTHGFEGGAEDEIVHWPNDTTVSNLKMFEKLQDVSFDISDLDVKIVRETKQRSLSISLKLFHLGFYNQSFGRATDMNYNVYLEEFNTSSMQAKFAGLTKVILKGKVLRDSLESMLCVSSGFFHYHHEEVLYWVSVFYNIFRPQRPIPEDEQQGLLQQPQQTHQLSTTHGGGPMVLRRTRSTPKQVPSPTLLSWMANKNFSLILEVSDLSSAVSTAACSGLHSQLAQARISVSFKPGGAVVEGMEWFSTYNTTCEVDIQGVSCSLADAKLPLQQIQAKRHYWGHAVYLGTLLMKLKKFGTDLKVDIMADNLQLEWSSSIYQSLGQMIGALCKSSSLSNQTETSSAQTGSTEVARSQEEETTLKISDSRRLIYVVKCDVSNINMFVTNSVGASVMTRIDSIAFNHGPMQTHFSVDGTKVQYIICDEEPSFPLNRSAEIHQPVAHVHQVTIKYVKANKECRVHILQTLNIQWRPPVHMCLIQGLQDARSIFDKFRGDEATTQTSQPSSNSPSPRVKAKSSLSVNVLVLADITLEAKLSQSHAVSIFTKSLLVTMTLPDIVMEVKEFCVSFDGHKILNITNPSFPINNFSRGCQIETLPSSHLKAERERAKMLNSATNRAWGISFDSIDIVFPYRYNFAACYDQIINTIKWLRLVHKVKKKPFTSESPLPADLAIKVKMLSIEISDDPFEVKMGLNYELLKDEGFESKKRKEVMDIKLMDLQKKQFIPVNKRDELYTSLYKKSSEIYIQRSQQVYNAAPIRTQLLIWLMEDLSITALADPSFNGKDNVIKHMKEIDPESPFPKEPIEFITLWCRYVSAGVKLWSVSLRDFPRPMLDVSAMHV